MLNDVESGLHFFLTYVEIVPLGYLCAFVLSLVFVVYAMKRLLEEFASKTTSSSDRDGQSERNASKKKVHFLEKAMSSKRLLKPRQSTTSTNGKLDPSTSTPLKFTDAPLKPTDAFLKSTDGTLKFNAASLKSNAVPLKSTDALLSASKPDTKPQREPILSKQCYNNLAPNLFIFNKDVVEKIRSSMVEMNNEVRNGNEKYTRGRNSGSRVKLAGITSNPSSSLFSILYTASHYSNPSLEDPTDETASVIFGVGDLNELSATESLLSFDGNLDTVPYYRQMVL